ncbi:MAG: DOMON-like domain-containing protein [Betaproteobacteria bacterium]
MRPLVCHPESRPGGVRSVMADAKRLPAGLQVSYRLEGDLARLRIPEPRPPRAAHGLWRHTCCEIFVARKGAAAYHEFNLSPSGEWAAHAFARYREGAMLDDASLAPGIDVRREKEKLELDAFIKVHAEVSRIGLAAVIEAADGALSYWALRHPPGRPDFHHRDAFALEL